LCIPQDEFYFNNFHLVCCYSVLSVDINLKNILLGCYYLVDVGYTNASGFLAPYRGQRYHLGGWTVQNPPRSAEEYFNMCHA
jgi:hypothetical protein